MRKERERRRRERERENEGERKERRMDRLSTKEVRLQSKLSHIYMYMSYSSSHLVDEERGWVSLGASNVIVTISALQSRGSEREEDRGYPRFL